MLYSFEQIEDYLEGNLTEDELMAFEQTLKNDPALVQAVSKQKETHNVVELYAQISIKDKVKRIHEKVKIKEAKKPAASYILKIAASLLLVIVSTVLYFLLLNNYSNDAIASNAFEPYPDRYSSMGEADKDEFTKGLNHYDKREFAIAIEKFKAVPLSSPDYISAWFYIGVSYLATDHTLSSIPIFEDLIKINHPYKEASQWYLALAYLKTNNESRAREILHRIINEKSYQHKQAGEILKKLDSPVRKLVL